MPVQNQEWMLEALRTNTTGSNLKSDLQEGKFNANLSHIGLAPNKAAYREQIKASGGPDITVKQPNWFAKHILGKQEKTQPLAVAPRFRPCIGNECKPVPVPPKPCLGKKCPPPPPPAPLPPPVGGVCQTGYFYAGLCQPWGYLENCDDLTYSRSLGPSCYAHLARVSASYCDDILRRLQLEELSAAALERQLAACSSGSQSTGCASISQDVQITRSRIEQLRRQYQMCRMAAGL